MKLNAKELENKKKWEDAGFILPKFDREKVAKNTKENPQWIHFGAGNIFRAFPAAVLQKLLDEGEMNTGLIVAEGYDYEIIDKMYTPHDNLSLLVTLKSNGTIDKTVVGSIVESLRMDETNKTDFGRLKEIFAAKSLAMASFTITEKGYSLKNAAGEYLSNVAADFEAGPLKASSYIGKFTALMYERYLKGELPVALVSMDNCSHNGTKLYEAVNEFAESWEKAGLVDAGFKAYINNPDKVSFTWSMIDKITPRPDDSVKKMLNEAGFEDVEAEVTAKKTYVAPFVNAEEPQYLVIEDHFPNGKLPLDKAGIIYTDRETVDKVEKMKVCTCLNPLHTALAVYGCLLSYTEIYREMEDAELKKLVEIIGYREGLPVVVNPGIINPKDFIDEVLNVRIPNPFMPDTPQRIATDTSQKLSIRFGETMKAYLESDSLDIHDLKLIPLVLAGWCRYLMGIDDNGNKFELSPDPMTDTLCEYVKDIKLGDKGPFHDKLQPILSDARIFGLDLYEAGAAELVEDYFAQLVSGKGAVRATLKKYVK